MKLNKQFLCSCGYTLVSADEARLEHFGWRKINNQWNCPMCTGNTKNFRKEFLGWEVE